MGCLALAGTAPLGGAFPILFEQCGSSIKRLARFDREQWLLEEEPFQQWRPDAQFDHAGLEKHARIALSCVQARTRHPPILSAFDGDEAFELACSRKVALEALHRVGRPDGSLCPECRPQEWPHEPRP
jgi:hypothetical protein